MHQLPEINQQQLPGKIELIHDALVMGIKNYFGKLNLKKRYSGFPAELILLLPLY